MNSFPPPNLSSAAASELTADEGKAFNIGPSLQRYHIDDNKKGADALTITHYSSNLPPFESPGRRNQTSAPPANWPTKEALYTHRIKTKIRGGASAYQNGRGDNPHDVDLNELRNVIKGGKD